MIKKVNVTFEMQNDHSFTCIVDEKFEKFGLIGYGPTAREAEKDMFVSVQEMKEDLGADEVPSIEIKHRKFDVGSFFSYYPFFNVTQFSKFTGLNPTQVRQYASGVRQPTTQKKQQLNEAVKNIIQTLLSDSRAFSID